LYKEIIMGQSPTLTTIPEKPMSFVGALNKLILGRKVTRISWNDKGTYLTFDKNILMIKLADKEELHQLITSKEDVLGKDWVIVR